MSYFHTGIRTIIGAEVFHGPVRDGKGWDHLAMVVRRNLLSKTLWVFDQFVELNQVLIALPVYGVGEHCL